MSGEVFILVALAGILFLNLVYVGMVSVGRGYLADALENEVLKRETRLTQNMLDFVRKQVAQDLDDLDLEWLNDPLLSFQTVLEPALEFSDQLIGIRHYDQEGKFFQSFPSGQVDRDLPESDVQRIRDSGGEAQFVESFDLSDWFLLYQFSDEADVTHEPVVTVRLPIAGEDGSMAGGIVEFFHSGEPFLEERDRIHREIHSQARLITSIGCFLISGGSSILLFFLYRSQLKVTRHSQALASANSELLRFAKSSALGSISAHLVHGLRGPVAGLRQFINSARSQSDMIEPEDWEQAAITSQKAKKLVDDVIMMIQDERTGNRGTLSVSDLMSAIQDKYCDQNSLNALDFHCESDNLKNHEMEVRNWNLLFLVLNNLIDNAVEAAENGAEIDIRISGERDDPGGAIQIQVADKSGGIPQHLISSLFEPKVSGKPSGSGIGLAISHQLIRQAHGQLLLEKSDAIGSVFLVSLPGNQVTGDSGA